MDASRSRPPDIALLAADLEGFFDAHPRKVVIDEAQRLPEVFPALRHVIDRSRGKGRFLLLGSASPSLMRSVSKTLAGRVALLELTPLLCSELTGTPERPTDGSGAGFRRSTVYETPWRVTSGSTPTSQPFWSATSLPSASGCRHGGSGRYGRC